MKRHRKFSLWFRIVSLAALALWVGCSQNLPTAPKQEQVTPAVSGITSTGLSSNVRIVDVKYTTQWIIAQVGPDGGAITIPLGSDTNYLVIPQGALDKKVTIKVAAIEGLNPERKLVTAYEFLPDELAFKKPANLVQYTKDNGAPATLYWFNPATLFWELQESATSNNYRAIFRVYHFSNYAVVDGSTSASGQ